MKRLLIVIALTLPPIKVGLRAWPPKAPDTVLWVNTGIDVHDTTREYIVRIDTVRSFTVDCWWANTPINDTLPVTLICDSIPDIFYREVWAPKVQVWLDYTHWRYLMWWLSEQTDPNPDTLLHNADSVGTNYNPWKPIDN